MSEPFWQKNSLVTHIFFDLCLFEPFCPVANFEQQSIVKGGTEVKLPSEINFSPLNLNTAKLSSGY